MLIQNPKNSATVLTVSQITIIFAISKQHIIIKISSVNPQVRKVVTEHLNWLIDIAAEVNARAIVLHPAFVGNAAENTVDGGFGADNILPFEEARLCEVELLKTCAERACKQGVILALENMHVNIELPRTYVIQTAEEQVELIDEVNSSGLQCTFDVGHARTKGTSPIEYAGILGQRIAHVHLKDSDASGGGDIFALALAISICRV